MLCLLLQVEQSIKIKCQIYWSCCKFLFQFPNRIRDKIFWAFSKMELHCERVLCIFVCHTQLLSIWLLAWIISEFSFKSLFSFSHSIIVYPKPRKVSYTHTLGTQFPCFSSVTDPHNLVETNNPIKYFTFDKTGNIAIIH